MKPIKKRRPSEEIRCKQKSVMLTPSEYRLWEDAAHIVGISVSAWVRMTVNATAKQVIEEYNRDCDVAASNLELEKDN